MSKEAVDLITRAKDDINQQLERKEAAYRQFRRNSPVLWKGTEGVSVHEASLAEVEKARTLAVVTGIQTRVKLDEVEAALNRGISRESLAMLIQNRDSTGSLHGPKESLEDRLLAAQLEEQSLLEQYGRLHPKVQTAQKQMGTRAGSPRRRLR